MYPPLHKFAIVAGMAALPLWAFAIVFSASLRPEFSHVTQYISELGERGSATASIMRYTGFVPTGLMHLAFAAFLCAAFRADRLAVFAAALIGVNGLARIGAGLFSCACAAFAAEASTALRPEARPEATPEAPPDRARQT